MKNTNVKWANGVFGHNLFTIYIISMSRVLEQMN